MSDPLASLARVQPTRAFTREAAFRSSMSLSERIGASGDCKSSGRYSPGLDDRVFTVIYELTG